VSAGGPALVIVRRRSPGEVACCSSLARRDFDPKLARKLFGSSRRRRLQHSGGRYSRPALSCSVFEGRAAFFPTAVSLPPVRTPRWEKMQVGEVFMRVTQRRRATP